MVQAGAIAERQFSTTAAFQAADARQGELFREGDGLSLDGFTSEEADRFMFAEREAMDLEPGSVGGVGTGSSGRAKGLDVRDRTASGYSANLFESSDDVGRPAKLCNPCTDMRALASECLRPGDVHHGKIIVCVLAGVGTAEVLCEEVLTARVLRKFLQFAYVIMVGIMVLRNTTRGLPLTTPAAVLCSGKGAKHISTCVAFRTKDCLPCSAVARMLCVVTSIP